MDSSQRLEPVFSLSVFAGQGTSSVFSNQSLSQARLDASHPAPSLLLTSCHEALQTELKQLTASLMIAIDVHTLDFPTPESLLLPHPTPRQLHSPVATGIHLFVLHVLRYLAVNASSMGKDGPNAILACSSGLLPACVISAASTTLNYIVHAVEVFRAVFWIGVRAAEWRHHFGDGQSAPWSAVVGDMDAKDLRERLEKFLTKNRAAQSLCITSFLNPTTFIVSGRPDILASFTSTLPSSASIHATTVNTLYHSSLLAAVKDKVMEDVARRQISFPKFRDLRIPIVGLVDDRSTDLVEVVLNTILMQPVDWDGALSYLVSDSSSKGVRSVQIINYGPGLGLARTATLKLKEKSLTVKLSDFSSDGHDPHRFLVREVDPAGPNLQKQEPIAIVGMAINMPGAPDKDTLWEVLEKGINTISEIPSTRFRVSDHATNDAHPGRRMAAHMGNFIAGHAVFDAAFFRISPREARSMDPQQRVLLHVAYHALENAGHVPDPEAEARGTDGTGVWIGAATADYVQNLREDIDLYYSTGTIGAFLSGRISYAMKLGGPSMVVNTACSSSLVAIYQACRALMNRDCKTALAGGVNIITSPDMFVGLDRGHFLSPSGQCKPFDEGADGYARGEGCGLFVLKRLSDARSDRDRILGVIRSVAVNQGTHERSITHPHHPSQAMLLRTLLAGAGMSVRDAQRISVVEAHGTGTQAGDTSEMKSIRAVLGLDRSGVDPLYITSIKANIGHLEAAAGAAGLAKLLLMFHHDVIPPQISLEHLNPAIAPLEEDHIIISKQRIPWVRQSGELRRMAVLNSFGAAGSNAALLLEEWSPLLSAAGDISSAKMSFVFGLSAKSPEALSELRLKYIAWLRESPDGEAFLADLAYTVTSRRQIHGYRLAVSASCKQELIDRLADATVVHCDDEDADINSRRGTVFLFTGQGAPCPRACAELYRTSSLFKGHIDECDGFLISKGFVSILAIICPESHENALTEPEQLQGYHVAMFALEYALARLWMSWGVKPSVVIGHSLGEYAALVIAEVLSLHDALSIVANRAWFIAHQFRFRTSGMLAVNLSPSDLDLILRSSSLFEDLSIACYNGAEDCVVSGSLGSLMALKSHLDAEFIKSTLLSVPFGYHCSAMQSFLREFKAVAHRAKFRAPCIPVCSTVLGQLVHRGDKSVFTADYCVRHTLQPVLFMQGIECLLADSMFPKLEAWIEIGPHTTLLSLLHKNPAFKTKLLLGSLRGNQDAWTTLGVGLSKLYCSNVHLSWRAIFSHIRSVHCIETPSYPFAETSFWVDYEDRSISSPAAQTPPSTAAPDYSIPGLCTQVPSTANANVVCFETAIDALAPAIVGHKVAGIPLCPASVYLDQVLCGVRLAQQHRGLSDSQTRAVLKDVEFVKALVYSSDGVSLMRTIISADESDHGTFSVNSLAQHREEFVNVTGNFEITTTSCIANEFALAFRTLDQRMAQVIGLGDDKLQQSFTSKTLYDIVFARVAEYAKEYRAIKSLYIDSTGMHGVAVVRLPDDCNRGSLAILSSFLEAMLQTSGFIANLQGEFSEAYICSKIGTVKILPESLQNDQSFTMYCHTAWKSHCELIAEVYAVQNDEPQKIVGHLEQISFRRVGLATFKRGLADKANLDFLSAPRLENSLSQHPVPCHVDADDGVDVHVIKLVADACDVSPACLNLHSNLQDLGVDSLMSIEILHGLQTLFPHIFLASRDLLSCRTIADVINMIIDHSTDSRTSTPSTLVPEREESSTEWNAIPANKSSFIQGAPSAQEEIVDIAAAKSGEEILRQASLPSAEILQPLQYSSSEHQSPLFLFHDGSGLAHYYKHISPLNRMVWGVHNPYFMTSQPWESIKQMAAFYARCLQDVSPGRQVLLGGWSFGGVVAVETARQLLTQGYVVKGVILIDTPCPVNHTPLSDSVIDFTSSHYSRNPSSEICNLIKAQIRMNSHLLASYDPRAFKPPEIAVPSWLGERTSTEAAFAWETLTGNSVRVWEIPGNHFQPFQPSNIKEVSCRIDDACHYLDSIQPSSKQEIIWENSLKDA